ncbi:MAG: GIY-YIG nuclease family protein [Bacteroidota bacterium]
MDNRLNKHNAQKVKSTKSRVPFVIHYYETFASRKEAVNRERFFKSINGYIWLKKSNII